MGIKTEAEFSPLVRVLVKRLYPQGLGSSMDSVGFCDTVLVADLAVLMPP